MHYNDYLNQMLSKQNDSLTLLINIDIINIDKNLYTLKLCMKNPDHKLTVTGLPETHLNMLRVRTLSKKTYEIAYV